MSCNEWKSVLLSELVDSISIKHKFDKDEIIFLNTSDILDGKVLHDNFSKVEELPGQAKKSIQKNDILFSEIRPKNRRFAYIDFDSQDYVVSTKLMVLRKKSIEVDNMFLYKFLTWDKTLDYLQMIAETRSGTFPQITFSELKNIEVMLPGLDEQKKIADILCSIDNKIDLNNEINRTLEEMAQVLFKRWFIDFEFPNENGDPYKSSGGEMVESEFGMIPKIWDVKMIKDISTITMGVSPSGGSYNEQNIGLPLLNGAADFQGKLIKPSKYTSEPKKVCGLGDMVFGVRATIGNTVFADGEYALGRGVAAVRPNNNCYRELLYFTLNNSMDKLISSASGSVFLNLKKADITDLKVCFNEDVVMAFHSITSNLINKVIESDKESEILKQLRDSLLPKLMSGEIRVEDIEANL